MNPDDDPQRQIADLERSMAQSAAGSEMPALGEEPRIGLRTGWAVLGLMIAALVVGGGVILTKHAHAGRPVAGTPMAPDTLGNPTGLPSTPTSLTPPPTTSLEIPGDTVSVAGIGRNETISCQDRIASVSGVDNTVVLIGHCARLDVSGVRNTVTVDSTDAIVVSGMNNHVKFRFGTPQLDQSGIDNTLERG